MFDKNYVTEFNAEYTVRDDPTQLNVQTIRSASVDTQKNSNCDSQTFVDKSSPRTQRNKRMKHPSLPLPFLHKHSGSNLIDMYIQTRKTEKETRHYT